MAEEESGGKSNAPVLALDNKEVQGFVQWFKSLPQVRSAASA